MSHASQPQQSAAAEDATVGATEDAVEDVADGTVAQVLTEVIARRGLTLAHLHRGLHDLGTPVSLTALSYWRSGRRQPDSRTAGPVLANLEQLLTLPAGTLRAAATPPPRRLRQSEPISREVEAVMRDVGYDGDDGLVDDSIQHVLDVDADGFPSLVRVRCLHRATRDGVDRRVLRLRKRHPDGLDRPFTALAGGRIGRLAEDRDEGVYAAEFVFDRPLRLGDTVVIEYQIELGRNDEQFYQVDAVRKLRNAMVWVRFHPDRVPPHVELYREVRGRRAVRLVDMTATTSVHHAVNGGASGAIGVRWSWTGR